MFRYCVILLFLHLSYCSVVKKEVLVPFCDHLPPGNESCYYQLAYSNLHCSRKNPCSRLFMYFGGGEEGVQEGNYDVLMKWWARKSYLTMVSQSFNSSNEAGLYPYFMEFDRLSFMINETRYFYLNQGLWTGEYLVIGGISHGATAPPISIANRSAFRNFPDIWLGEVSTAVVLFDGISNPASWEAWLGQYSILEDSTCWGLHSRNVGRYGDGYPLEHSCRNHKCFCSDPKSAPVWANDTLVLNSTNPPSPYTCESINSPSSDIYWFIASCNGENRPPCSRLGNIVPQNQQSELFESIKSCPNTNATYYISETCGHSLCGSRQCGAGEASRWLESIWPIVEEETR